MNLFGHTFGHKTNSNREHFQGISPTADKEAEAASEAAFNRLEQSERLGKVTMHGAVHADSSNVIDMHAAQAESEPSHSPTDHQITA